jgi:hypothetical protein
LVDDTAVLAGETLADLVQMAEGAKPKARRRATITLAYSFLTRGPMGILLFSL